MFGFGGAPVGGGATGFGTVALLVAAGMGFTGGGAIVAIPVGFEAGVEVAGVDAVGEVATGLNGSFFESEASEAHASGSTTNEVRTADILKLGMGNSSC